jgi:hypothetical protein
MTFLLSEDEALKALLKGMTVVDQKSASSPETTRNVGVWFGQPDQEIISQSYPYITIDMIDISEDYARSMRGKVKPDYFDNPNNMVEAVQGIQGIQGIQRVQGVQGAQGIQGIQGVQGVQGVQSVLGVQRVEYDPDTHNWEINYPIPVNIDYQITTYARQPRHDRSILSQLLYNKIPMRFAVLEVDNNDAQGTIRRLDVLDVSKRDITEQGKRLFVNAITVRISSEIAPETYTQLYKTLSVHVTGTTDNPVLGRGTFTPVDSFTNPQP